jgi:integrase
MKQWIAADVLDELGRTWLRRQLEPLTNPVWQVRHRKDGKPDPTIEQERLKLEADVVAVHAALVSFDPGIQQEESVPFMLSAGDVAQIERAATASAKRPQKADRSRYLYWLLRQLEGTRFLTFKLPVIARDRPPRSLAFDALDPHLPTMTRFRAWQHHIASRALDLRPLKKRPPSSLREREFLTLMTLFAFGGPCGRQALTGASQIEVRDLDLARGELWLRNTAGDRTLNLTLHPVQALALVIYVHDVASSGTRKHLFPSIETKKRRRTFQKRVAAELASTDATLEGDIYNPHGAPAGLRALLTGARRWMLEIYPPFLVSVVAGRFRTAAVVDEQGDRPRLTRRRHDRGGHNAVAMSEDEKQLRRTLRNEMKRFLKQHFRGPFNKYDRESVCLTWQRIALPPETQPPPESRSQGARRWNLFLLTQVLNEILWESRTDRYKTFERWFDTGCSLLDELGGRPVWIVDEDERDRLSQEFGSREVPLVSELMRRMAEIAPKYGLQQPLPFDQETSIRGGRSSLHAAQLAHGKSTGSIRAIETPSPDQIEKMAIRLIADAERAGERPSAAQSRMLRLYLDLLALGMRKTEAASVHIDDIDNGKGGADLIVRGTKTKAANRLVPLESHPHQGSVQRLIADARAFAKDRYTSTFLEAAGMVEERRHSARVGAPRLSRNAMFAWMFDPSLLSDEADDQAATADASESSKGEPSKQKVKYSSIDQFNRALKKIGERVGIDHLTPHIMRHASISNSLTAGVDPELIAKHHGHAGLPTTFQHYVHRLSEIQKQSLEAFLKGKENSVWVAEADARVILGVSRQRVNKYFTGKISETGNVRMPGMIISRSGRNYINAGDLAGYLKSIKKPMPRHNVRS